MADEHKCRCEELTDQEWHSLKNLVSVPRKMKPQRDYFDTNMAIALASMIGWKLDYAALLRVVNWLPHIAGGIALLAALSSAGNGEGILTKITGVLGG